MSPISVNYEQDTIDSGIRIEGLRDLQKALKATAEKAPKVIQGAGKAAAEDIVLPLAERNAAKQGTRLADRLTAFGTTRTAGVRFYGHRRKRGAKAKTTDARLQEFGGRAPLFGNREHWNPVKPINKDGYILRPALDKSREEVIDTYLDYLDEALRRYWDTNVAT